MINLTFFLRSLKRRCYGDRFLALIGENLHTPPPFCALAFHNGREDRALTPPKTLLRLMKVW